MQVKSPSSLLYPIRVTELLARAGEDINQTQPLFRYTYQTVVVEGRDKKEVRKTFPEEYQSENDGKLLKWNIHVGQDIKGAGHEILVVEEPCAHEIQFGGMCARCGKDMTE